MLIYTGIARPDRPCCIRSIVIRSLLMIMFAVTMMRCCIIQYPISKICAGVYYNLFTYNLFCFNTRIIQSHSSILLFVIILVLGPVNTARLQYRMSHVQSFISVDPSSHSISLGPYSRNRGRYNISNFVSS